MPNYLGELKPAQTDLVGAFARGYAAPDQMQAPGLQNALTRQQAAEAQIKRSILDAFAQDPTQTSLLGRINPLLPGQIEGEKATAAKSKMEYYNKLQDYIYPIAHQVLADPSIYPKVRPGLAKLDPELESILPPPDAPPETIKKYAESYIGAYNKRRKLETTKRTTVIGPEGEREYEGDVKLDPRLKGETPLERARRELYEAELADPTRKQRPKEPKDYTVQIAAIGGQEQQALSKIDAIAEKKKTNLGFLFADKPNAPEVQAITKWVEDEKKKTKAIYAQKRKDLTGGKGKDDTNRLDALKKSYQATKDFIDKMPDGPEKEARRGEFQKRLQSIPELKGVE